MEGGLAGGGCEWRVGWGLGAVVWVGVSVYSGVYRGRGGGEGGEDCEGVECWDGVYVWLLGCMLLVFLGSGNVFQALKESAL